MKRFLIAFLAIAICLAGFGAIAEAAAPDQARQVLQTSIDRILSTLSNPDYLNPTTRGPLRRQIEDEVLHIFDFSEFSSRTVGPRWKTFTPEQKKAFSDAFADLLMNTYLNRVTGYNGETVNYAGVSASPDGGKVEVKTFITMKDGKKIPVNYRMLYKDGNWRVYDVIIENISLVKNYRTQFHDILNSASPEELIGKVSAKAREIAAQGGQGK